MKMGQTEEYAVGTCLVRVCVTRIDLPGREGWIGSWEIYRLPWNSRKSPLRVGDTDVQTAKSLALGMAKTIAISVARSI